MTSSFDSPSKKEAPALRIARWLSPALLSVAVACSSEIGESPGATGRGGRGSVTGAGGSAGSGAGSPTGAGGSTTGGGGATTGGGGATTGGGGATTGGGAGMPPVPVDPGTKGVHRLNSNEYNATVADVLGTKLAPANSSWLGGEIGGFDNIASVLDVDAAQYKRYFDAAGLIADDVFATAALKAKVVTCATTDDATCVQSIISNTGRLIFRRPLTADEVTSYRNVYTVARQQGENHDLSIKQVLRSLLSSAEFLFRIETDPNPSSTDKHPLNAYELASRLSYFLWSSAPDEALLTAAADNSLLQDDKLVAAVDRMLMDPAKYGRLVQNFAGQWLGARKLPEHAAAPTVFPDWSPQVATSLTSEMYLYFTEFLKTDRSWLEFLQMDVNFVDAASAKLYGVPAPSGTGPQRLEITTDQRVGFLGLGGFLALSSIDNRTSPTLRGRWILSSLLCAEPPAPPPGVPELTAGAFDPALNVAKALEEHRRNPACSGCHKLFDPLGMSLEQFDGIGKFRTMYADGATIDPTGEFPPSTIYPQGVKFTGLKALADILSKDPRFAHCITETMFTYSLGRLIVDTDHPYLDLVQANWMKATPSIRRLIQSLVLAETFRYRRGTK
jgi:hypothetical protein